MGHCSADAIRLGGRTSFWTGNSFDLEDYILRVIFGQMGEGG